MAISTAFNNNRTQAVRLPAEMRFPDSVKKVEVRVTGQERVIAPMDSAWDSFFLGATTATEDFMAEQASPSLNERAYVARSGQMIDATFVEVPRQRNKREENALVKEGGAGLRGTRHTC